MGILDGWKQRRQVAALEGRIAIHRAQSALSRIELNSKLQEHWSACIGGLSDPGLGFEDRYYIDVGLDGSNPLESVGLEEMRRVGRDLDWNNGFAKSFGKNMTNFVVGRSGMTTTFDIPKDPPPEFQGITDEQWKELIDEANAIMRDFSERNDWVALQREAVKNTHRDGDWFLRDFVDAFGQTAVRVVDAGDVKSDDEGKWPDGFITDAVDHQLVLAYLVDGVPVAANEITHIKVGTDSNVLRGVPTLWSAREALLRAQKILRNMGKITEVQAAIAAVRTHETPIGSSDHETWLDADADKRTKTDVETGKTIRQSKLHPGSVIDLQQGDQMQFPVGSAALTHFVAALGAVLRGIASEIVFPEFMLSADASNNNFASILEAGAPATKNFESQQGLFEVPFRVIAQKVIRNAVLFGMRPAALALDIKVTGPQVDIRDRLKGAQRREIEMRNGILSVQTWTDERGDLVYEDEQERIEEHEERTGQGEPLQVPEEPNDPGAEPPNADVPANDDAQDRSDVT